jgi:hypothetical protein
MELYIKWSFWLAIVGIAFHMLAIPARTYPRIEKINLGEDIIKVLWAAFFAFWAWRLVYA